jgi:hypothetical protein
LPRSYTEDELWNDKFPQTQFVLHFHRHAPQSLPLLFRVLMWQDNNPPFAH